MKPVYTDPDKEKHMWYKLQDIDPMSVFLVIPRPRQIKFFIGGYCIAKHTLEAGKKDWFVNTVIRMCKDIELIRKLVSEYPEIYYGDSTSIVFYPLFMDEDKREEKVDDIIDNYLEHVDENGY